MCALDMELRDLRLPIVLVTNEQDRMVLNLAEVGREAEGYSLYNRAIGDSVR
jgi:hypothetical protein